MPHSELHRKRLSKNLIVLAMVLGWCALIWAVTMVKLANASGMPDRYEEQRKTHQADMDETWQAYDEQDVAHQKEIDETGWRWWYSDEAPDVAKEALVGRTQPIPSDPALKKVEEGEPGEKAETEEETASEVTEERLTDEMETVTDDEENMSFE